MKDFLTQNRFRKVTKVILNCNLCHRLQDRGGETNLTQSLPIYLHSFSQLLALQCGLESTYRMFKSWFWRFSSKIDQFQDFGKVKMAIIPLQECSYRLRSLLALLGTQAKCERHLGNAGMRVGGVENVEKWPFFTIPSASTQFSEFG